MLIRDDDLLNSNGLYYTAKREHLSLHVDVAPYGRVPRGTARAELLARVDLLLLGSTPAGYHRYAPLAEIYAARAGWKRIRTWTLAPDNTVEQWRKPVAA